MYPKNQSFISNSLKVQNESKFQWVTEILLHSDWKQLSMTLERYGKMCLHAYSGNIYICIDWIFGSSKLWQSGDAQVQGGQRSNVRHTGK